MWDKRQRKRKKLSIFNMAQQSTLTTAANIIFMYTLHHIIDKNVAQEYLQSFKRDLYSPIAHYRVIAFCLIY